MLEQIVNENPDVRVVYRHFPLPGHDKSLLATQAAEAAGLQGKFWEMHDLIFAEQQNWANMTLDQFKPWLLEKAGTLSLDMDKFTQDLDSQVLVNKAMQAQADAQKANVGYTPFLVIDGREFPEQLPRDKETIMTVIKLIQLESRQFANCPKMEVDPARQYTATIKTAKGDVVVQLFADKAPMAVNNFVFLAKQGWYNGVTFHRVLADFVAQAGDPTGTGYGGPGYAFSNEVSSDLMFDKEGVLAMANSGGPESNGSQFFITYGPQADLNGKYTIFGQVIQGMDVVKALTPRDTRTQPDAPAGDQILEVTISEK